MGPSVAAVPGFMPESALERSLSEDPVLQEGLAWGEPRRGHPEGSVGAHVADLLDSPGTRDRVRDQNRRFLAVHEDSERQMDRLLDAVLSVASPAPR